MWFSHVCKSDCTAVYTAWSTSCNRADPSSWSEVLACETRLAMKRTCLEAEMESPTIRKVRVCFGEAKKQLFSPTQECLTSLKWLASLATSSQSTWGRLLPNSFLCFTGNLVIVVAAVRYIFNKGITDGQIRQIVSTNLNHGCLLLPLLGQRHYGLLSV